MSILDTTLAGIPVYGSPYVAGMDVVRAPNPLTGYPAIYVHRRLSIRTRFKRPHGRTNGPRRRKTRVVVYQPGLDALLAHQAQEQQTGGKS